MPTLAWACSLLAVCPLHAFGQAKVGKQQDDQKLGRAWTKSCERVRDGDPWTEIADELEELLSTAHESRTHGMLRQHLDSLRAAEQQAPLLPDDRPEATPEVLVALLLKSRLNELQRDRGNLISAPLHRMPRTLTRSRAMHWDFIRDRPDIDFDDPAIRIVKRGRAMIPALIYALDDQTATRCTFILANSTQSSMVFRRSDLALALIEAITRCKFYKAQRGKWFSQYDEAFRTETIATVEKWWQITKDSSPLEARSHLIAEVDYDLARTMIELLVFDGEESRAIAHMKSFLLTTEGKTYLQIATRLAELGDAEGITKIAERLRTAKTIHVDAAGALVAFGGRREYKILRGIIEDDLARHDAGSKSPATVILQAIAKNKNRRMAIPLLALALNPEDDIAMSGQTAHVGQTSPAETRADFAAKLLQELTRRNFRFDPATERPLRQKAIERMRDWWQHEGEGLYGYHSAAIRRGGGIR